MKIIQGNQPPAVDSFSEDAKAEIAFLADLEREMRKAKNRVDIPGPGQNQRKKKNMKNCYITGDDATNVYYFGSEIHVTLSLSQPAFAHYIIRAGKDEMHKTIMGELKEAGEALDAFLGEHPVPPEDDDAYIDASIQRAIMTDKMCNLLTQKAESGVRILKKMKKDYQATKKLSS